MPIIKPSGQKARVSFSVPRPKSAKKKAAFEKALATFVKKHGGKIKKKKKTR
jgi:hypothetical protein